MEKTNELATIAEQNVKERKPINKPQKQNSMATKYDMEMVHLRNFIDNAGKQKGVLEKVLADNPDYVHQKVLEFSNLGLSVANKDYYPIPYGNLVKFDIDYKGLLKTASMEAKKNGYQLIAKADTIRKGFTRADVHTDGLIDNIIIENGKINEHIETAYAILSLFDIQTRQIIMQKVEVLPIEEYKNAKSKSKTNGGGVYKEFETEMAKKIALRRGVKILNTMFASDVLDKLFSLDNESYDMSYQQTSKPQLARDLNQNSEGK